MCSIWVAGAALQLQVYYFLEPVDSPARKHGLLRAYHTAMEFISQIERANEYDKFSRSVPRYFGAMVKLAALVVMKLLFSNYSRILDIEAGKKAFNTAMSIQRAMSVENNDFPSRDSVVLTHLWAINQSNGTIRDQEPTLRLNTRHSASVLHDSLWVWRNYYAEREFNTEHLGRPPRVLPSLIQHSPVATMDTPNVNIPFDPYASTPQNSKLDHQQQHQQQQQQQQQQMGSMHGMQSGNMSNTTPGLMSDGMAAPPGQGNGMMDNTSPDPFDLMSSYGSYMIPEADSSGMFYPNWMWDAAFSMQN